MKLRRFGVYYIGFCALVWGVLYAFVPQEFHRIAMAFRPYESSFLFNWRIIAISFSALILALIVELKTVGWKKSAFAKMRRPGPSTLRDQITCLLAMFGILDFVGYILTLGLPFFLGRNLLSVFPVLQKLQVIKMLDSRYAQIAVTFLLADFFLYVGHRIMHISTPLWKVHEYHHAATEIRASK